MDWDTLSKTVENAIQAKLDSEFNRNEHIRVLYEDANYLFLEPITHIGSQKYGANTRWCTTMRNESGTFKRYVNNGYLAYLIKRIVLQKVQTTVKLRFILKKVKILWDVRFRFIIKMITLLVT